MVSLHTEVMRRKALYAGLGIVACIAAGVHWLSISRFSMVDVPTTAPRVNVEAAPMCPWRQPEDDLRTFFSNANHHEAKAIILSDKLTELKQRLGHWPTPDENPFYLHRIYQGRHQIGTVATRRVKGEYGAIEIVLAVDTTGRVRGLHLQRLREPDVVARVLRSRQWLQSFEGMTLEGIAPDSNQSLNHSVKRLPPPARRSAQAIAEGVRSLLILLQTAEQQSNSRAAHHH